jgi:hypothetical protein
LLGMSCLRRAGCRPIQVGTADPRREGATSGVEATTVAMPATREYPKSSDPAEPTVVLLLDESRCSPTS